MIVLVTGGRDRHDVFQIADILSLFPITELVVGDATGVDTIAYQWTKIRPVECHIHFANWRALGKSAGVIRNQRMLDEHKVDLVVAFPSKTSIGTYDMLARARAAKIPRIIILP